MRVITYCLMLLIVSCGGSKSPVSSRSVIDPLTESERLGGRLITIVQSGDTWHGIAFENSLSVANLTAWNGMTSTDILRIGQRLRLTKPLGFQPPKKQIVVVERSSTNNAKTNTSNGNNTQSSSRPTPTPRPGTDRVIPNNAKVTWSWPLNGKVVTQFSVAKGRKGIDIAAPRNQKIKTAAPGKVVYQGNGIKGYNNLVIIKHNDELLSAYAHNEKVFVNEGQFVKAGQVISTVGLKNGKSLLHFEIRKEGKPVNPLNYLQ